MPAAATRRPGEARGVGGGTLRVVCLGVLGVLGIALTAGLLAGRSGGAGQSGRRSRRSIAQARAPAAASLLPEFRDTANCSGDVLQGRMANYEEVRRPVRLRSSPLLLARRQPPQGPVCQQSTQPTNTIMSPILTTASWCRWCVRQGVGWI